MILFSNRSWVVEFLKRPMRLRLETEIQSRNDILSTQARNDSSIIGRVSLHLNLKFFPASVKEAVAMFLAQRRPKLTRIYDANKHGLPISGAPWQYQWILTIASCLLVRRHTRATAAWVPMRLRRRELVSAHVHEWLAIHCCLPAVCSRPAYLPSALDGACLSAVCSRRCVWRCWHRRWLRSHPPSLCILPPHLSFFLFCYYRDNLRSRSFHYHDCCFP